MSPVQTSTTSVPSISEDMSSTSSAVTSTLNSATLTSTETHSCPYNDCNKSFSKKYNLKAHLRLHTGEQPFECDRPDCRKKFKWRSSLSSHSVWHTRKDNANACALGNSTTKSSSPSARRSGAPPQKPCSTRAVRVAPHPSGQHVNMNASSVSASVSASVPSASYRKKRPRSDVSGSAQESTPSLDLEHPRLGRSSGSAKKPTRSSVKKRRVRAGLSPNKVNTNTTLTVEEKDSFVAPGSPVTSDGSNSDQALDVEEFSCDILQPLLGRGEALELIGDEDEQLFGYEESGSYVPLSGFDSRFEQFDLDNFANFYLNKMEGL